MTHKKDNFLLRQKEKNKNSEARNIVVWTEEYVFWPESSHSVTQLFFRLLFACFFFYYYFWFFYYRIRSRRIPLFARAHLQSCIPFTIIIIKSHFVANVLDMVSTRRRVCCYWKWVRVADAHILAQLVAIASAERHNMSARQLRWLQYIAKKKSLSLSLPHQHYIWVGVQRVRNCGVVERKREWRGER